MLSRTELAKLVIEVLDAQKNFFKNKTQTKLVECKKLEAKLRKEAEKITKGINEQGDLFAPSKNDKPLTECMVGRDAECNHPNCPVTDEDAKNGNYCPLPVYDWRH